jgi:hypothetical protein
MGALSGHVPIRATPACTFRVTFGTHRKAGPAANGSRQPARSHAQATLVMRKVRGLTLG